MGVDDLIGLVGIVLAVVSVAIAWLSYRRGRNRKQLEYVILSKQRLVSPRVAHELTVLFDGQSVGDPSLAVLRIVSSGDKGIPANTFEGPLVITFHGAEAVVSASVSAKRPPNLTVRLTPDRNQVFIEPTLLNSGDLIEIQALVAGLPADITVEARIEDVVPRRLNELPYPPGSGPEGEMVGFDKFVWALPPTLFAVVGAVAIVAADVSTVATIGLATSVAVVCLVIYPMHTKRLVRRRRIWSP